MAEIVKGLGLMYMVSVIAMLVVIIAMAVDLVSGIRKAKIRGEARTSYGFSRSLTKFLVYQGILLIATCIDTLLHFGLYNFTDSVYVIPCVELLMAIILCGVELWSVYEKAEDKERRRMAVIAQKGAQVLDKDAIAGILTEVLKGYLEGQAKEKREGSAGDPADTVAIDDNVNFE